MTIHSEVFLWWMHPPYMTKYTQYPTQYPTQYTQYPTQYPVPAQYPQYPKLKT